MPTMSIVRRAPFIWLAAIVGASFVVRTAVAWLRSTPALFPDEYIYASIGRSLASSGRPLIRGHSAHFPGLLEPIVTAPAWLLGDVNAAYRLSQAIGALAMSLAAIPVYLLARRLGLSARVALAVSALAVLVPDLLYASFLTSEPFAYPLVLGAVTAAVTALTLPTRRAQLAFVVLAGLAALARAQFVVLPLVFLLAVVAMGVAERRVRAAVRAQVLPLSVFVLPGLALLLARRHVAGFYNGAFQLHIHPISFLRWAGWDCMALAYASGWIIVPGALLGLWLALRRPLSRQERAFGLVVAILAVVLIAEVGLFQTTSTGTGDFIPNEIKERYLFYLVPLAGLCFALYAKREWPLRVQHLALAAALLILSVRVPLSGFAVSSTLSASPVLFAVFWLTVQLGRPGNAASVVAAAVAVMSVVAVLASRRPRAGTPVVLALALLAAGATSAGAVALDVANTRIVRSTYLPADASWVDTARMGHVSLLQAWGSNSSASLQELFWNRSITRVLLLPGAAPVDRFATQRVQVGKDGTLRVGGRVITEPLLVDGFASTVRLRGARMVKSGPSATLWLPTGQPRLALYMSGRYHDGWLANAGTINVWPAAPERRVSGWLTMRLSAQDSVGPVRITFQSRQHRTSVRVRPGAPRQIRIAVCGTERTHVTYRSKGLALVGPRAVSVKATEPVLRPSSSACRGNTRTK